MELGPVAESAVAAAAESGPDMDLELGLDTAVASAEVFIEWEAA